MVLTSRSPAEKGGALRNIRLPSLVPVGLRTCPPHAGGLGAWTQPLRQAGGG